MRVRTPVVAAAVIAVAPAVWFTHLAVVYALVPLSCRWESNLPLHAATAVAVVGVVGSAWVARRARAEASGPGCCRRRCRRCRAPRPHRPPARRRTERLLRVPRPDDGAGHGRRRSVCVMRSIAVPVAALLLALVGCTGDRPDRARSEALDVRGDADRAGHHHRVGVRFVPSHPRHRECRLLRRSTPRCVEPTLVHRRDTGQSTRRDGAMVA
jgi:hypothetical protein